MANHKINDKNDKLLSNGDIIDLHQTVNGQNLFIIISMTPLDIRYAHDIGRKYEYDTIDLLKPDSLNGSVEFEIIGNIKEFINQLSKNQ